MEIASEPKEFSKVHDMDQGHSVKPDDIAVAVIIGRTSEFFDFFVYAIASVVVFPQLVFPFADAVTGTLYSFAIFALAFIARPVGSAAFMALDRTHGRAVKLTVALFLLGTFTVSLAFVPSYVHAGGWAIFILAALRFGQGFALGGTWDGLAALLALSAPANRRGWYAMVPQLGAPLGLIVASSLFAYLLGHLQEDDFFGWGWRFPFFIAFAINVVALFARLRIVDTEEFRHLYGTSDLRPTGIMETMRAHGRSVLIGAFAPLASFALFHMVTVFPLSWVYISHHMGTHHFLFIEAGAAIIGVVTIALSGVLADRIGRRKLLAICAVGIAIFSALAPVLLGQNVANDAIFMLIGFALLGLTFGQCSGAVASNFQNKYRYTGSALTSDLAWMFGAGFAPFCALYLSSHFGLATSGLYLLSGAVCTLVALAANRRLGASNG